MFGTVAIGQRIERAEAELNRAVARAVFTAGTAPLSFIREIGSGLGTYLRPGSPLNKLIGIGIEAGVNAETLTEIEQSMRERDEPTRIELSTLSRSEIGEWLTARGYRLLGFENVLVRSTSLAVAKWPC